MKEITVYVHERIMKRHPEISENDVKSAFHNILRYRQRSTGEMIAVGADSNSRLLELVFFENIQERSVLIYHAQTPPTKKTQKELDFIN